MGGWSYSVTAGVLAISLLAGNAALAQGRGVGLGGPGRAGESGARAMGAGLPLAGLNLTQAQQDLIRDIRERGREAGKAATEKLRAAQQAQQQAVNAIPMNEGVIRAATLALAEAQADVAVHQARIHNEIWNALTPEQQNQVRMQQAQREQRRQERQQQIQERRQTGQ